MGNNNNPSKAPESSTPQAVRHTPGPWSIGFTTVKIYKCAPGVWHETEIHVGDDRNRGNAIATVCMGGAGATNHDRDSVEANAYLICAAPDMLEALKAGIKAVSSAHQRNSCYCDLCKWSSEAEQVVSKAEGREL